MPINSPTGFLDITNATLRTSNLEAQNLLINGGNIYVSTDLETNIVLNLENVTRKGNVSSNTIEITNATTGIIATGNIHALKFIGSGAGLTSIPSSAISGTLSQWSDGANSDVYIASNVGIGNVHTLTSNTLQVGGNLYVRDTDANVLTVNGNVVASYFEGDGSKLSGIVTDLQGVTDNGNVTTNVVQFSNVTTGLVTTANIEVGGDIKVVGLTAGTVPYVASDKFLKDSFITMTGDATVITSNLDVTGNIFMRGKKFIVESETKLIKDAIIGIANNNTVSTTDKGIIMQNTTGNVAIIHHGAGDGFADQLTFGYTADPLDTVTVTNDLTKELTVNVLGNVITQNNLSVGGTLSINTISAASSHSLQAVTNLGNVTSNTVQFSNAITSLVASSNIVATGNVSAGHDTNTTSYFGRAAVGYMGNDNHASFAHVSHNDPARYAVKQTANGATYINTPATQHIRFTVNDGDVGAEKMRITGAGKVGIGVSAPHANLHVVGNVYVSSNLTVGGNVSDLNVVSNVNMLHTSNTASIKLNSNVVAEFPRSKKFMKFPRVALTGPTSGGYTVTASSIRPDSGAYSFDGYNAFDNNISISLAGSWTIETNSNYNSSGNVYNPSVDTPTRNLGTGAVDGEWIKLELPNKVRLEHMKLAFDQTNDPTRAPKDFLVYGSNDNVNWTELLSVTNAIYVGSSSTIAGYTSHDVKNTTFYQYFGVVVTKISGQNNYFRIFELEYYGVPEYDPEAHGTDVTVKSYPNVPNTDFLDVFVDAGNASGFTLSGSDVTGVTDLSTPANTMSVTGVTYDSTNKAFVFSGSQTSFIKATLANGNGNYAHTLSSWFMMTDYSSSWLGIMGVGSNATGEQSSIAYDPNQDQLYFGTYGADIYVPHKPELGKWYHVAATFSGGSTTSTSMNIYLNGVNMGGVPNGTQTPSFTGNHLCIGGTMNTNGTVANNPFKGQIGNARFYRHTYSSEEIYQLYAYQKEYFGYGDLSMTLKAGRLGIGTSEPKATLDVRGTAKVHGRPNFTESLFYYTGNAGSNYYVSTYKNRHGFYLNTVIPLDSHIGNYGTGGDNQAFTEANYGSSNELCGSHFDCMVYWLKNAPVGHVHRLNWCSNNGSGGSQTYGQKTSGTQIRLWGYWFHTGTYDKDWTGGIYFNISTSTVSVFYEGATFQ